MSELLQLCNQYFGTKNFYEILKVEDTATEKELKKAYHKLSLLVHPDRVGEDEKLEATEKFKVLGRIHSILSDKNKRAVYDESGEFDEDSDALFNWLDYWRSLFKKITVEDIRKYEEEYIGSETEIYDVKRAYLNGKGSMDHLLETVPFANHDNESRYMEIVQDLIKKEEVPEYKSFTEEPKSKKERRRKKWEKEKAEAATISEAELNKTIQENQARREKKMMDFFSELESKYGGNNSKRKSIKNGTNNKTSSPTKRRKSKKL